MNFWHTTFVPLQLKLNNPFASWCPGLKLAKRKQQCCDLKVLQLKEQWFTCYGCLLFSRYLSLSVRSLFTPEIKIKKGRGDQNWSCTILSSFFHHKIIIFNRTRKIIKLCSVTILSSIIYISIEITKNTNFSLNCFLFLTASASTSWLFDTFPLGRNTHTSLGYVIPVLPLYQTPLVTSGFHSCFGLNYYRKLPLSSMFTSQDPKILICDVIT